MSIDSLLRRGLPSLLLGLALGCNPAPGTDGGGGGTQSGTDDSPSSTSGASLDSTGVPATSGTTSAVDDTSTSSTGVDSVDFVDPDGGFCAAPEGTSMHLSRCDLIAQDCCAGEKCMPWANDGGDQWNAVRCVPIAEEPGQPGDPCTVDGSPVSGFDDCDISSMCWDVDPETNEGTCVAFCESLDPPSCADPDLTCVVANDGSLVLCLSPCDPLAPTCPEGNACTVLGEEPVCVPGTGQLCAVETCEPTEVCLPQAGLADCTDGFCCTAWCDLDAAEPDLPCAGVPGHVCVPYPGEQANLGYCGLP